MDNLEKNCVGVILDIFINYSNLDANLEITLGYLS
jgi:hypothetical protein